MPNTNPDPANDTTPRDAQKGGQGAVSKEHPEIALKQGARPIRSVPTRSTLDPEGLTATQIDFLCKVGERDLSNLTSDEKHVLELLRSEGYIARTKSLPDSRFELTAKGSDYLAKRGAGLNEA